MIKDFSNVISWMTLIVGAYFLIFGIIKKGSLYKNDYPREIQDEVRKTISVIAIIAGIILIPIGIIDVLKVEGLNWLSIALWALGFVHVVVSIIIFKKKFSHYLK